MATINVVVLVKSSKKAEVMCQCKSFTTC